MTLGEHFLVLRGCNAVGNDASACLVAVLIAAKHERTDRDGLIHIAARAEIADRAALQAAIHRLKLVDNLHGPHLGRAHQRTRGKGRRKEVERIALCR